MKDVFLKKLRYKADINGDLTIEEMVIDADKLAFDGQTHSVDKDFKKALFYDISRTIINILSNATIKFMGTQTQFCRQLQNNLVDIFFLVYENGYCFVVFDETGSISKVTKQQNIPGSIKIVDKAFDKTGINQKKAADKALDMYGVVTNANFSIIDERGVLGLFAPPSGTDIKPRQSEGLAKMFREFFGAKKGQKKYAVSEIPMTYQQIPIPVKDLDLLNNKKDATATVARIFGIQEDMILSGSTFDNKENAIIQTYTDYKGVIYNWITQIVMQRVDLINPDSYDVTFPGVPQMNKPVQPTL